MRLNHLKRQHIGPRQKPWQNDTDTSWRWIHISSYAPQLTTQQYCSMHLRIRHIRLDSAKAFPRYANIYTPRSHTALHQNKSTIPHQNFFFPCRVNKVKISSPISELLYWFWTTLDLRHISALWDDNSSTA